MKHSHVQCSYRGERELRKQIDQHIRKGRRSIIGVLATEDDPFPQSYIYTVGNAREGFPEIICLQADLGGHGNILNLASDLQRNRGRAFDHREVVLLAQGARFPVKFLNVTNDLVKDQYTGRAGWYLRTEDYEIRQLVMPDTQGRFPGDPECAEPYAGQLMLNELNRVVAALTLHGKLQ